MHSRLLERLKGLGKTVGFRLTLWFSFFLTLGCLGVLSLAFVLLSSSLERGDHERIEAKFWDMAGEYQENGLEGLEHAVSLQGKRAKTRAFFIRAVPPGKTEPVAFGLWQDFDLAPLDALLPDKREHWASLRSRDDDTGMEVLSLRLSDGMLLQVGGTNTDREEVLGAFRRIVALIVMLVIVLSVPGGFLLARRALKPIRQLLYTIQKVESGAVGSRVPVLNTGDELDELGVLFNRMLARIESLISGMRNALDNVAHDLRTPMARLRMGAEVALSKEAGLAETREALADCIEESDRLVGMLGTLMDISEAETGLMTLKLEPLDLAELLEEGAEVYRYLAEEKGLTLAVSTAGAAPLRGDRNRMRQVVANLIDNAVKYTPSGGRIDMSTADRGSEVELTVKDSGQGIPAHDLPRVWDRLYRGDSSRSERGLGLGLSLVKAVVTAHHGRVQVDSAPGEGCRFTLTFPSRVGDQKPSTNIA